MAVLVEAQGNIRALYQTLLLEPSTKLVLRGSRLVMNMVMNIRGILFGVHWILYVVYRYAYPSTITGILLLVATIATLHYHPLLTTTIATDPTIAINFYYRH